jgi:hypothetical protein
VDISLLHPEVRGERRGKEPTGTEPMKNDSQTSCFGGDELDRFVAGFPIQITEKVKRE